MTARSYLLERPLHEPRHPIVWTLPLEVDDLRQRIDDCLGGGSTLTIWIPERGPARILGWEHGRRSLLIRFGGKEAPLEPLALSLVCSWAGDRSARAA